MIQKIKVHILCYKVWWYYNYYRAKSYLKIKRLIKEFLKRMVLILGLRQVLFLKLYLGDLKRDIIDKSGWLTELDTF